MELLKGARPVPNIEIYNHYRTYNSEQIRLDEYCDIFYSWIVNSHNKTITGLNKFKYRHFTQGTSQSFDNFVLRHATKQVINFAGDFQYHACISKQLNHKVVKHIDELKKGQALIISFPFSDTGNEHSSFKEILDSCDQLNIPVCLDIAYWGIAKDLILNLDQWQCIQEVTCSLSKPFYVLETHRIGIRFSREYFDDGICMINEVRMANTHSMNLGSWFMQKFSNSYNWETYGQHYYQICKDLKLKTTNTVIFALGDQRHCEFNRGIDGNNRVCLSEYLKI
jgi:hypothetical protein